MPQRKEHRDDAGSRFHGDGSILQGAHVDWQRSGGIGPYTRRSASFLFVYGTLRREGGHAMSRFLARHARFVDEADFQGRLFLVAEYPGAVPSDDPGDRVRGDVFELRRPRWLLRKLDEYEGCDALAGEAAAYVRTLRAITTLRGERRDAWIYLYNRPTRHLPHIISGDFYARG